MIAIDLENMTLRVIRANPRTLFIAQKINASPFNYTRQDVESIIITHLRNTGYNSKTIDSIIELHPDKKFFDTYYNRKKEMKKELNCIGCGSFSADGDEVKKMPRFNTHQKLFWGGTILVVALLLLEKSQKKD